MSTELELYRAHQGLTAAAFARRARAEERPYEYIMEAERHRFILPGSNDDRHAVPAGLQDKLAAFCRRRGYPVTYTTKTRVGRLAGSEGATGLTIHGAEMLPAGARHMYDILPHAPKGVYLAADIMSPASLARVTIHEAAHVISQNTVPEELEEPVAESAAGLVAGTLRITDGRFSVAYLAQCDQDAVLASRRYAVSAARLILREVRDYAK